MLTKLMSIDFGKIKPENIRNFTIIAHIDAGKSTLADRLLEITGAVPKGKMQEQYLDSLAQERQHGITIKLAPASLFWQPSHSEPREESHGNSGASSLPQVVRHDEDGYLLNLVDTPGHADFAYEVSRALRAVEGAVLLIDAVKGVQAQTLSNFQAAQEAGLKILPVLNKIDQSAARVRQVSAQVKNLLGTDREPVKISAKTGQGVLGLLDKIVEELPSPAQAPSSEPQVQKVRALIFDSYFDPYFGVKAMVRVFGGLLRAGQQLKLANTGTELTLKKVGIFTPLEKQTSQLESNLIGWVATGIKDPGQVPIGETIIEKGSPVKPLPGFKLPEPKVFADFFPIEPKDFPLFAKALGQLRLNDPALTINLIQNEIFGRGFQVGALGRLHLQITQERLEELAGCAVLVTAPSVSYQALTPAGQPVSITSPAKLRQARFESLKEPWIKLTITSPADYLGAVLELLDKARYQGLKTYPLDKGAGSDLAVEAEVPLAETFLTDFYDQLKSVSRGYASADYRPLGYRPARLYFLEALLAGREVPGLAWLLSREQADKKARALAEQLKAVLPRQVFSVPIQLRLTPVASLPGGQGKIIAREDLPALKKNVTAGLYGGDFTRKKKLLQKQRKGQRKLSKQGKLTLPREVYRKLFQSIY